MGECCQWESVASSNVANFQLGIGIGNTGSIFTKWMRPGWATEDKGFRTLDFGRSRRSATLPWGAELKR